MEQSMDRVEELLLDHALWGLSVDEERELQELADRQGRAHNLQELREHYELVGASAITAMLPSADPMPVRVQDRIRTHADRFLNEPTTEPTERKGPRRIEEDENPTHERGWVPWLTALASAAVIVLAFESGWFRRQLNVSPSPSVQSDELAQLSAADLYARYQQDAGVETFATGSGGDALWNVERQDGVLRISGLKPNDPEESQYQLWIFDDSRTTEGRHLYPVDGGVFDVTGADLAKGEALVRFNARIPVGEAFAFVVTEERPGGVVVSDRQRIRWAAGDAGKIR